MKHLKIIKPNQNKPEVLLTIAGFDGTGGAGTNIDTKICSFLKVPNVSVITSIVIQNPKEVIEARKIDPKIIKEQLWVLKEYYQIEALNIGIFGDLETLAFIIREFNGKKIVLDPIASSGDGKYLFLKKSDIFKLKNFFKYIYLLTPNIPETEIITGIKIESLDDIKKAAKSIGKMGVENVLIKGGHIKNTKSWDILYSNNKYCVFKSQLTNLRIHGTGSFLNSAICSYLLKGESLISSIKKSRNLLRKAIKTINPENPILYVN